MSTLCCAHTTDGLSSANTTERTTLCFLMFELWIMTLGLGCAYRVDPAGPMCLLERIPASRLRRHSSRLNRIRLAPEPRADRWLGCAVRAATINEAMARICNDADRPLPGCVSRGGLVRSCLRVQKTFIAVALSAHPLEWPSLTGTTVHILAVSPNIDAVGASPAHAKADRPGAPNHSRSGHIPGLGVTLSSHDRPWHPPGMSRQARATRTLFPASKMKFRRSKIHAAPRRARVQ